MESGESPLPSMSNRLWMDAIEVMNLGTDTRGHRNSDVMDRNCSAAISCIQKTETSAAAREQLREALQEIEAKFETIATGQGEDTNIDHSDKPEHSTTTTTTTEGEVST